MIKRVMAIVLCLGVLGAVIGTPTASATMQPLWSHLRSISLNLSRSNNTVTSTTTITGQPGTTRIAASFTLERWENNQYQHVDSWSASSNSTVLRNTRATSDCPAGTYRLSVTVTITRNGTTETVSESLVRAL